jgi:hypothetical protein
MSNNIVVKLILLMLSFGVCVDSFSSDVAFSTEQEYIMILDGKNSIYQFAKVNVKVSKSKIILLLPETDKPFITLKINNKVAKGSAHSNEGDYLINAMIKSKNMIEGTFKFKVTKEGKKQFLLNDAGVFKIIPYTRTKLTKLKKLKNERFYQLNMYHTLEEMGKVSPWARKQLKRNKSRGGWLNEPVILYAKVIDQFGKPVVGAELEAAITKSIRFGLDRSVNTYFYKTDKNGEFKVKQRGTSLSIYNIEKLGYRGFSPHQNFKYKGINPYIADPKHPVIFIMSKITNKATYLLKHKDSSYGSEDEINLIITPGVIEYVSFFDFKEKWDHENPGKYGIVKRGYRRRISTYKKDYLSKNYDFSVTMEYDKKDVAVHIKFTANGDNSGFIISDKFSFEAPKTGYKKEFKYTQRLLSPALSKKIDLMPAGSGWKKIYQRKDSVLKGKCFYIKSRNPSIYSQFKVSYSSKFNKDNSLKYVKLSFESITNPYGDRDLEPHDILPGEIRSPLAALAKDAFYNNKRPTRPNIKKMMDEFQKTHIWEKEKDYDRSYHWVKNKEE